MMSGMAGVERAEVMVRMTFGPNRGIAFSPDGALLAVCSAHHVEIIEARGGLVLRLIRGHAGPVADVAFSPAGDVIVTGSHDGTARTWEAATGSEKMVLAGHRGTVADAAFTPGGTRVVTGSSDRDVRVWDAASRAPRSPFEGDSGVNALAVSPDGALVAATTTITARTWEIEVSVPGITVKGGYDYLTAVAFDRSGTLLGIASTDKTATIWDVATGVPLTTLTGHGSSVTAVAFSPAASRGPAEAATGFAGRNRADLGRDHRASPGRVCRARIAGQRGRVRARRVAPRHRLRRQNGPGMGPAERVAAAHAQRARVVGEGRRVLPSRPHRHRVLGSDGPDLGRRRRRVPGHAGRAYRNGGGRGVLATASGDATARLWDAVSGAHLATLVPTPSGGYITLLPDARYKLEGDPGDCLWWAAQLQRLGPADVSGRFPEVRRLPPRAPILPD
jgi:hypothetical protein